VLAPNASNASGLRREVFGFATAGSLGDPSIGYPSWNFDLISTVAFFAIRVTYNGVLVADADWNVWSSSTLTGLVSTAHQHGTKVVVTLVPLYSDPVDFCDTLYNDQTTVSQIVNQVQLKGVDGVNIDYEGQLTNCINTTDPTLDATNQTLLTKFAKDMRAGLDAVKPGYYLSIDTYSGSAGGNSGFFNIPDLNQYVDSFFVMAYDMDYANQPYAPLSCSSFCLAPVSPLSNYYWNDTTSMSQYSSVVGPGKTILGQPYYGRVACVASPSDHAQATGAVQAATYTGAAAVNSSPDVQPGTFAIHRDADDPSGLDRWDSWYDNSLGCWRVMHWSDVTTLSVRYNFVNQMNLRGVGLWTLNYGGGAAELWSALQTYFKGCYSTDVSAKPASPSLAGTPVTVTSTAGCPDANPVFQFWILSPGASSYQLVQPYSSTSTYSWSTAGLFPGIYRIAVWARDALGNGEFSNSLGSWDAVAETSYTVTTNPCSASTLTAAPAAPAGTGATVALTGHSSGCPSPLYQFWIEAPGSGSFTLAQAYSASSSYTFDTTNKAPGAYVFGIWARDTSSPGTYGNSLGRWDAANTIRYTVTTCSSANLTSTSSAAVGATITVTATAGGCPNPNPMFQFWVLAPGAGSWTVAQAYSPGNILSWNTAGKPPGTYQVAAWARDASSGGTFSNSFGRWDAASSRTFTVTTCTGVRLVGPSAAPAGATITFTASAVGCPNPSPVYQFWVLAPGASSWTMVQAYSTGNTLTLNTSGNTAGPYLVAVWVRDSSSGGVSSNSLGTWDVSTYIPYTLK
jgi:spore germination protein YaaH